MLCVYAILASMIIKLRVQEIRILSIIYNSKLVGYN